MFNLKLFNTSFRSYFHQKLDKDFEVVKNVKKLRFEGDWGEL